MSSLNTFRVRLALAGAGLLLALAAVLSAAASGTERLAPRGPWSVTGSNGPSGSWHIHTNPWSVTGS